MGFEISVTRLSKIVEILKICSEYLIQNYINFHFLNAFLAHSTHFHKKIQKVLWSP